MLPISAEECEDKSGSELNWIQYAGKCYYVSSEKIETWRTADKFCKNNGGFLVSIHSQSTLNFLKSKVLVTTLKA